MKTTRSAHPVHPKIGVQTILAATLAFALTFTTGCEEKKSEAEIAAQLAAQAAAEAEGAAFVKAKEAEEAKAEAAEAAARAEKEAEEAAEAAAAKAERVEALRAAAKLAKAEQTSEPAKAELVPLAISKMNVRLRSKPCVEASATICGVVNEGVMLLAEQRQVIETLDSGANRSWYTVVGFLDTKTGQISENAGDASTPCYVSADLVEQKTFAEINIGEKTVMEKFAQTPYGRNKAVDASTQLKMLEQIDWSTDVGRLVISNLGNSVPEIVRRWGPYKEVKNCGGLSFDGLEVWYPNEYDLSFTLTRKGAGMGGIFVGVDWCNKDYIEKTFIMDLQKSENDGVEGWNLHSSMDGWGFFIYLEFDKKGLVSKFSFSGESIDLSN